MPKSGMIKAENKGEGYTSLGWQFSAHKIFNEERLKAVFITNNGGLAFNMTEDSFESTRLQHSDESRLEVIAWLIDNSFEKIISLYRH